MRITLFLSLCLAAGAVQAQQKPIPKALTLSYNDTAFVKDKSANCSFKSMPSTPFVLWVDTTKWAASTDKAAPGATIFEGKGSNRTGIFIADTNLIVDIDQYKDATIRDVFKGMTNPRLTQLEYRTVNGHDVLSMEIRGIMKGRRVVFLIYTCLDLSGYAELTMTDTEDDWIKNRDSVVRFMSGLTK